jgi:hypothetical protein
LLCDHCFQADSKRGDDAQVLSQKECISDRRVNCEVCFKSLEQEREENAHLAKLKSDITQGKAI